MTGRDFHNDHAALAEDMRVAIGGRRPVINYLATHGVDADVCADGALLYLHTINYLFSTANESPGIAVESVWLNKLRAPLRDEGKLECMLGMKIEQKVSESATVRGADGLYRWAPSTRHATPRRR